MRRTVTTKCRRLRRASMVDEDQGIASKLLQANGTEEKGQKGFAKLRRRKEEGSAAAASTSTFTGSWRSSRCSRSWERRREPLLGSGVGGERGGGQNEWERASRGGLAGIYCCRGRLRVEGARHKRPREISAVEAVAGAALLNQGHECTCRVIRVEMHRRNEAGRQRGRAGFDVASRGWGSTGRPVTGGCSEPGLGQPREGGAAGRGCMRLGRERGQGSRRGRRRLE